ncbi:mechanosensitive ion channel family protein [Calditrichota bacterium]
MTEFLHESQFAKPIYSVGVIVLALLVHLLLKILIKNVLLKITDKTKTDLDDKIILSFKRHSKNIISFLALYYILRINSGYFSAEIYSVFDDIFYIIFFIIIMSTIFFIVSIIIDWYMNRLSKKSDTNIVTEFGPLIQRLIKGLVIIIGITIVLEHFKVDIKGLVVSLGVGSLALAFAAQDTLGNMIAGFVIMIDRPFRKGDRIKLESGEVGDVFDIGLRSIKIIDFENTIHIIPNKEIANKKVINYSYPDEKIRVKINVGVAYGSDVDQVKKLLVEQFKDHPEVLDDPEPTAYFLNMGDSSLDFWVVGRINVYTNQWRISEELRINIYKALVSAGIEIPFPQRTVHFSDKTIKGLKNKSD